MKFSILILISFINLSFAYDVSEYLNDLKYFQIGSCETNNLNFNAARFSKIALNEKKDNLDLYLQTIIFFNEDGTAIVRTMRMGLVGCKNDQNGYEVCSYKPYNETKAFNFITWSFANDELILDQVGTISKIRNDFPWLGYELKLNEEFNIDTAAKGKASIGGKVSVNFNHQGSNSNTLCKKP